MQKHPKTQPIRRIQDTDYKSVIAIVSEFPVMSGFSWTPQKLEDELSRAQAWGIWEGEELGAFVLFRENLEAHEITVLGTSHRKQRRGLMKKLMLELIDARSHKGWWLEVHEDNQAALSLYKALGFTSDSWRRNYYPDGKAAILMSRKQNF